MGAGIPILELSRSKGHPLVAMFPLHTTNCKFWLMHNWLKQYNLKTLFRAPLDEIKEYFGVPIGYYFGFAQFYISYLIPLAIVGLVYAVLMQLKGKKFPSGYGECMVLIIICWSVIFADMWKRRESELRVRWGMSDLNPATQRETFVGQWATCKVTGELNQVPFKWIYRFRRFVGISGLMVFVSIVLATYAFIFWTRYMRTKAGARVCADGSVASDNGCDEYRCVDSENGTECNDDNDYVRRISTIWQILLAIFNACQILVYDWLFTLVSSFLTDWENHKSHASFDNFIVLKIFSFKFVNAFLSLFYLSYLQHDIERTGYNNDEILDEVGIQLGVLFGSSLLIQNFLEIFSSTLAHKIKKFLCCRCRKGKEYDISPAEGQLGLQEYRGTLYDMCELVIQYGYVTMFVAAFPLVPFIALLSAIVEIRHDGYKLLHCCRRPIPYNTPGIGVWAQVLGIFSMLSVINNVMLCVWLTDWPSRCLGQPMSAISSRDKNFLALTVCGVLGILVLMMKLWIPDVPRKSKAHVQRQQYVEAILCNGQKLHLEMVDHQTRNSGVIENLKTNEGCWTKFVERQVSEKLQNLLAERINNSDSNSKKDLRGVDLREDDMTNMSSWGTIRQADTLGLTELMETDYKAQPQEGPSIPNLTPSQDRQVIQMVGPSVSTARRSSADLLSVVVKDSSGLQFTI